MGWLAAFKVFYNAVAGSARIRAAESDEVMEDARGDDERTAGWLFTCSESPAVAAGRLPEGDLHPAL